MSLRNFKEKADLTKVIRSILDSYPSGSGILRELAQNSDDARATVQTFILDLRSHPNQSLVDPDLQQCQGPALMAINDTLFSEDDWKAISTLHGSSKTADETKIGKFGIGVRACYHITDNPHFLSDRSLVIFDPHERFSAGNEGGVRTEDAAAYPDQMKPFDKTLAPAANGAYPGTVVRLPLRTQAQAVTSKIKDLAVDPCSINALFQDFIDKELSVVMLFLKHIRSISLKVIHANGKEEFFGSARIVGMDPETMEKRRFARNGEAREETFLCTIELTMQTKRVTRQTWRIVHRVSSSSDTTKIMSNAVGYDVGAKLAHDKLFSHVALAFPIDPLPSESFTGRLFTLLPLPLDTDFPFHMHGILALTQDRQSLRNIKETGSDTRSREKLLVEWNRAIFNKFLPETWVVLLTLLVSNGETSDIWSAWPAAVNRPGYWQDVLAKVVQRVVDLDIAVFPTFPDSSRYGALSDALVAFDQDDQTLRALSNIGLVIIKPPPHVFQVLASRANAAITMLRPDSVRQALLSRVADLHKATDDDKDIILKYLVLASDSLATIIGLDLLPTLDGPRKSLSCHEQFCLVDQLEGELFGGSQSNGVLVALSKMDADVADAFLSTRMPNVNRFGAEHVQRYLYTSVFGAFSPAEDDITDNTGQDRWLETFWRWMGQWSSSTKSSILPLIGRFHLLPTTHGTLRKLESRILLPVASDEGRANVKMQAWSVLGVRFLHQNIVPHTNAISGLRSTLIVSPDDVAFLVDSISSSQIVRLEQAEAVAIREHLVAALRKTRAGSIRLDNKTKQIFRQLPIFPLRVPISGGGAKNAKRSSESLPGPLTGSIDYVRVDDSCPVPFPRDGTVFFDVTSGSSILGTLIDPAAMKKAKSEIDVLVMVVDDFNNQPEDNQDRLLVRIVARLPDLPDTTVAKLGQTPFVAVSGSRRKLPPCEVIDPRSSLASLFAGEPGKLPTGKWSRGRELNLLTAHVPFRSQLTHALAIERIAYLTTAHNSTEIFRKSRLFLRLLDENWSSINLTSSSLASAWLPIAEGRALAAPSQCRDGRRDGKSDAYLFDLVLSTTVDRVENANLRAALGWNDIPLDVLRQQLAKALSHTKNQSVRLHALITELARRVQSLSPSNLDSLREAVGDLGWIPVDNAGQLAPTALALLRAQQDLPGGRFRAIPRSLIDAHRGLGRQFLLKMGCVERPGFDALLDELSFLQTVANPVSDSLRLLQEITSLECLPAEYDRERVLLPCRDNRLHPISDTYFVDSNSDFVPDGGTPVHPRLSQELAHKLGVPFLSSLELGDEGDDDDDIQMGEDFVTRVSNLLKEHDIDYALNEFLANAADAGAKEFALVLDERAFESGKVLGPNLAELQRRPALVLYNDAKFTKEDFIGLRKVGEGGKRSNPDSIGRYGLGAMSLFHFTDVVQIVSDGHLLILDPSGRYLPPRNGRPRTSLLRSIADVAKRYPDQLAGFQTMFGFSSLDASYGQTLFRLPLRDSGSVLSSMLLQASGCNNLVKGQYYHLARDAVFFTGLGKVTAYHQPPTGDCVGLWEIQAKRENFEGKQEILALESTHRDHASEKHRWLVAHSTCPVSSVPAEHQLVLAEMGLDKSLIGLVARLALRLDLPRSTTERKEYEYWLFSSLRLPVRISLPGHISAPFAITPSRRHIRLDPADKSGARLPHAAFNPSETPRSVRDVVVSPFQWWPIRKRDNEDEISRLVVDAFYELVPSSSEPICLSVTSELIAPVHATFARSSTPYQVGRLLRALKPANYVELPYRIGDPLERNAAQSAALRFAEAPFVRDTIWSRASRVVDLYHERSSGTEVETLDSLVHPDTKPTYICATPLPEIFAANNFVHQAMEDELQGLLLRSGEASVYAFDAPAVLVLLRQMVAPDSRTRHPRPVAEWISQFWHCYNVLPGPPAISDLRLLPLIPTTDGDHISLAYAERDDVLTRPMEHDTIRSVLRVMQKMNLTFCKMPSALHAHEKPFTLTTFLSAIAQSLSPFASLSELEVREVGQWIRARVGDCSTVASKTRIRNLPIWEARKNGVSVLVSANDLQRLPYDIKPEAFDGFTTFGFALAAYSSALETVMAWAPKRSALTSQTLAGYLSIPATLSTSSLPNYVRMLREFLRLDGDGKVPVPDGDLRMRDVGDLYSPAVPLFVTALQTFASSRFPHPNVHAFNPQLVRKGLNAIINWDTFLLCARTVSGDLTERGLDEAEVGERARAVFDAYNSRMPGMIMSNEGKWRQLAGLRFVHRRDERSTSSSYETASYIQPIAQIVSPSEVVLDEYEPVAWSQRALMAATPSAELTSLNKRLGVPTAKEVVDHLAVLALRVAPEHPNNRTLIQQLRATYKWLDDNKLESRNFLLLRAAEPLFLNVDDPVLDSWQGQWKSSEQLEFDIPYDYTQVFQVRLFLQDYRSLVIAAGAGQHKSVQYRAAVQGQDGNQRQTRFNEMRLRGELTDIRLRPRMQTDDDPVAPDELRAHSDVLAAAIPHMLPGFLHFNEASAGEYEFPGTAFGARAVLEYVYVGKIKTGPGEGDDAHMTFLRDLLELLPVADEWEMDELKDEVGRAIDEWGLLSSASYRTIEQEATTYTAQSLINYCHKFKTENRRAVAFGEEDEDE
ncbi:hypothetical protein MKEN_01033800 [Mycena kentingensis (nom. inval.)]|nr:hypothetical protein MKEN_01033800 [Mycena kentingensis (nom. inval.)]